MKSHWSISLTCLFVFTAPLLEARDIIPLERSGKGIETISATVGGKTGVYLFDSGVGISGVTPDTATAIGCKPWGKVTGFRANGERLDLPRCNVTKVALHNYVVQMPQLSVFDLQRLMGPASTGLSGILGLDLFAGQVITLNIARHQVVIEDAASLAGIRKTSTEVAIRLVRAAEGASLTVDLGIPTPSGVAWMEIDTGNYGPSLIDKSIASLLRLDPSNPKPQALNTHIAGGVDIDENALVKDLIMDGNLGRSVLRHWEITIDLQNQRAWIKVREPSFGEKLEKITKKLAG